MGQARKEDFCVYCREVRPYSAVRKNIRERIRDKDYSFVITTYVCGCCHHEMSVPGVFDLNSREIDDQYSASVRSLLPGILRDRCRPKSTLMSSAAPCPVLRS